MRITFDRKKLHEAVKIAVKLAPSRPTLTDLLDLNVSVVGNIITIENTDTTAVLRQSVFATSTDISSVQFAASAKRLRDALKGREKQVTLEICEEKKRLAVTNGSEKTIIAYSDIHDLGELSKEKPEGTYINMRTEELLDALQKTAPCLSKEEKRYYLKGVFMHLSQETHQINFVATDGHTLAHIKKPAPRGLESLPAVIIPHESVEVLIDVLKGASAQASAEMYVTENHVSIAIDGSQLLTKTVAGSFPDYTRVVPCKTITTKQATFQRKQLAASMASFIKAAGGKHRYATAVFQVPVTADYAPDTEIECIQGDNGTISAVRVGIVTKGIDAAFEFGIEPKYLERILKVATANRITACLSDPGAPIRFDTDNCNSVFVVMPKRSRGADPL